MSTVEPRQRPAEAVAGLMAAAALFVSLVGTVHKPARVIPVAVLVALIAAGIGGRHQRLATWAVVIGAIAFVVGMSVAVATDRPLF